MSEKIHSRGLYLLIYVALLLLLTLTVALSFVDIGRHANNVIAIAIACAKGLLIILFFMHVRYQPWINWFFASAGFIWLGIFFVLCGAEYFGRNHPRGVNPKGEPTFLVGQSSRSSAPPQLSQPSALPPLR